jgi:DNA-binding transcriptional LysR family regulator
MLKPLESLPHLQIFVAVAESLNFSAAAKSAGITTAAVSRAIGKLEDRLGVPLFVRTTRSVALTGEGRILFERAADMLAELRNVEDGLRGSTLRLSGTINISAPTTYGHARLLKVLPRFVAVHPGLTFNLSISNRNVNLIEDGFDVAIRLGELSDSRLVSRKLEDARLGFYAAPNYLKNKGKPKTIADLREHACVPFILPSTGKPLGWLYLEDGETKTFAPTARVHIEDDVMGCLNYCIGGGGVCQMLAFTAEHAVQSGELVEILKNHGGATRPFSLIYRRNGVLSPRIKAFSDFLAATKP